MRLRVAMVPIAAIVFCSLAILNFQSLAGEVGPVPPCPWPIPKIENPAPGTPDAARSLLGEWTGKCEFQGSTFRYIRMIVYKIEGNRAGIYFGWGSAAGSSVDPYGGWGRPKAEVIYAPKLQIKWQRPNGWPAIFTLIEDNKLKRVDVGWGTWYEITVEKANK